MADSNFTLYRGAAATSNTTLYTSPLNMAVGVTNIAIVNDSASSVTATINLATFPLVGGISIAANSTQFIDLDQIIYNGETITGSASTTTVDFHIAGYEVY
jgi:hypothetical protein